MKMPKEWIRAGGVLGLAILTARATRTPLATLLSAMPFLINELRKFDRMGKTESTPATVMTREEAALILGVTVNASAQEVQQAHRRLITKNHPDAGGTDYLAAKINQARDIMVKQ